MQRHAQRHVQRHVVRWPDVHLLTSQAMGFQVGLQNTGKGGIHRAASAALDMNHDRLPAAQPLAHGHGLFHLGMAADHRNVIVFGHTTLLDMDGTGCVVACLFHAFGRMIEANPLLSLLMHHVGAGPALAGAKLAAVGCGSLLHLLTVHRVVAVLTGIYLAAAVGPWVYLLFMSPMRLFAF